MRSRLDTWRRLFATERSATHLAQVIAGRLARRVLVVADRVIQSPQAQRVLAGRPLLEGEVEISRVAADAAIVAEAAVPDEPLPLEDRLVAHLQQLVNRRTAQLCANAQPFELDDALEGVHDLRVASRRL